MLVMDMVMEGWLTIGDQGGGGVQHGACHGCNKEVNKVLVMDMVMEGVVDHR